MKEIIRDVAFEQGFDLLTTDTRNGRNLSGVLDYDGQAKPTQDYRPWMLSQWWGSQDLINAPYLKGEKGEHIYQNNARRIVVDNKNKTLTLELNSYNDYIELYGRTRNSDEMWSHLLIEQNFKETPKIADLKQLIVHLDFTINKDINMDVGQKVPCAQVTWYFTITNVTNGDSSYESQKNENPNDFFWFGLPLYDSRYDFTEGFQHVDQGFTGATNKLIYSLSNKNFLDEPIEFGKKYSIDFDILPHIKKAYIYGLENGAMQNSKYEDLVVNYMNLGWENPGSFDSSLTLSNISLKAIEKEQ